MKRVYSVDPGRPVGSSANARSVSFNLSLEQSWPVCHILDNTTLYIELMRAILEGKNPGSGRQGYYLASSGSVVWEDLYDVVAAALAKRKLVDDETVKSANDETLSAMGAALGCPKELVPLQLGGK